MLDAYAGKLRDLFLILALLVFVAGIVDVLMLAYDFSFGTGIMLKLGMKPHSISGAGVFFALVSIAFGIIELNRSTK
jgi:hypothetical protein